MAMWPQWIFVATGWSFTILGLAMAGWAIVWDRPRGRRRCPVCWYNMTASPTMKCSECGHVARTERHLLRTRRKWRWFAAAAVPIAVGYVVSVAPRVKQVGWSGAVPTTILIWWVTRSEPDAVWDDQTRTMSTPSQLALELARRARNGQPWDWQWRWMLTRVELVRYRERWPAHRDWEISVGLPYWLQNIGSLKVTSPLRDADVAPTSHMQPWSPGRLSPDTRVVQLEVNVGTWSGKWPVPVEQVESVEQAITPVQGGEVDAAIRRSLDVAIVEDQNPATGTDFMIGARLFRSREPILSDVAVGLLVELRTDERLIQEWKLALLDNPFGDPVDWIRLRMPVPGWDSRDEVEMLRWTVRVRGDADVSLTDLKRAKYWAGEYTVPLRDFLRARQSPN